MSPTTVHIPAILTLSYLVPTTVATVVRGATLATGCSGTLRVFGAEKQHTHTGDVESLGEGITTSKVQMEGCGCYIIYQGPNRTGRAYFVTRSGIHNISLGRIRSVYRLECDTAVVLLWSV